MSATSLFLIVTLKASVAMTPISDYPSVDACQLAGEILVASWQHDDRRLKPSFVCVEVESDD